MSVTGCHRLREVFKKAAAGVKAKFELNTVFFSSLLAHINPFSALPIASKPVTVGSVFCACAFFGGGGLQNSRLSKARKCQASGVEGVEEGAAVAAVFPRSQRLAVGGRRWGRRDLVSVTGAGVLSSPLLVPVCPAGGGRGVPE